MGHITGIINPGRNSDSENRYVECVNERFNEQYKTFLHNFSIDGLTLFSASDTDILKSSAHGKERYSVVCDSQIYNHDVVARELRKKGIKGCLLSSDEGLIREAFKEWGSDTPRKFYGAFAFAVYDSKEHSLFLARDRVGLKPLYYYEGNGLFIFSTTIRSILLHPAIKREVNESKVYEYFSHGYSAGEETLFRKIKRLNCGSYCLVRDGKVVKYAKYHTNNPRLSIGAAEGIKNIKDIENEFVSRLKTAINAGKVKGNKWGLELSGGADSSLLAAIFNDMNKDGAPISTFSVSMCGCATDERKYVEEVISRLNIRHKFLDLDHQDYYDNYLSALKVYEEPFVTDRAPFLFYFYKIFKTRINPNFATAKFAFRPPLAGLTPPEAAHSADFSIEKSGINVLYNGDGPDELFGGYNWYGDVSLVRNYSDLIKLAGNYQFKQENSKTFKELYLRRIPRLNYSKYIPEREDLVNSFLVFEQENRGLRALEEREKFAALNNLEVRAPYLYEPFVDWANSLPSTLKVFGDRRKIVEKRILERYFKPDFVYRKKIGFQVPYCEWLREKSKLGRFLPLLHEKSTRERGWFDYQSTKKLIGSILTSKGCLKDKCNVNLLRKMIAFELWQRLFID